MLDSALSLPAVTLWRGATNIYCVGDTAIKEATHTSLPDSGIIRAGDQIYGRGVSCFADKEMEVIVLNRMLSSCSALFFATTLVAPLISAKSPEVGDKAPDFTLSAVDGKAVRLADMTSQGTVVLIVLRGFPGYQCPFCNRQAQDFISKAQAFAERGVHVVMVYPGPPQDLGARAAEFLADKHLPGHFTMLLDPGYQFTNQYGLRWDAPGETAYPSTFLIDRTGTVFFSKIVKEHGGRTTAAEVLDALPKPKDHTRTETVAPLGDCSAAQLRVRRYQPPARGIETG